MPAFDYFSEELLQPIAAGKPCGDDLQYDLLFAEIREARRADDPTNAGAYVPKDGLKAADWNKVAMLCLEALAGRTKDLRLGAFLAEAAVRLDGFDGFAQTLRLCRELMVRFWDQGLHPRIEMGDVSDRAASLDRINSPLPDSLRQLPLTRRKGGENYSLIHYRQAEMVGTTTSYDTATADRRAAIDALKQQGYTTFDQFGAAAAATPLAALEELYAQFEVAQAELKTLGKMADEKFGADAPSFMGASDALKQIGEVLQPIVEKRRAAEVVIVDPPELGPGDPPGQGQGAPPRDAFAGLPSDQSAAWSEAEALVRKGSVEGGLAQMAALAASESSGRARFMRKLMLADVCLRANRPRLAKTILQELNEQIKDSKLDKWESSALVGAVWARLYKLYRKSDSSTENEQAVLLYSQLCHLDPWQAYRECED